MTDNRSSGDKLRAAATGKAVATSKPDSFPAMLTHYKKQIAAALPKHISGDRMLRVALTAFRQNDKLQECEPASVFASVVVAAQLGLEPGIMGQGYLIPYNTECQFVPGWQGLIDLVNRAGRASAWTGAVFEGDEFEFAYGSNPYITHKPGGNDDQPEKLTHVYAVGKVKGAEQPVIEVWSVAKITRHRDRFNKVGRKHYSYQHFEQYGRKVALLQVLKYLPKSIEMAVAQGLAYGADQGQVIDIKEAMEGTFLPPPAATLSQDEPAAESSPAPHPDKEIEWLRESKTLDILSQRWDKVVEAYKASATEIPLEVEAARNDRSEALKYMAMKG